MATNKLYLGLGEEAARGAKESGTVGYIPLLSPSIPKMEFDEKKRADFRGEDSVKGVTAFRRMGQKWSASLDMPLFSEAGSTKGMTGSLAEKIKGYL